MDLSSLEKFIGDNLKKQIQESEVKINSLKQKTDDKFFKEKYPIYWERLKDLKSNIRSKKDLLVWEDYYIKGIEGLRRKELLSKPPDQITFNDAIKSSQYLTLMAKDSTIYLAPNEKILKEKAKKGEAWFLVEETLIMNPENSKSLIEIKKCFKGSRINKRKKS